MTLYLLKKIKTLFSRESGYSLLELTVAVGIFATVVSVASGAFVLTLQGSRKTFTSQNVSDNVRFVMEVIAKEMRMGTDFDIQDVGGECVKCRINFTSKMPNRYNQPLEFRLRKVGENGWIEFDDSFGAAPLTAASNVKITDLRFEEHPGSQERITIILQAESVGTTDDVKTTIQVQTTVSSRTL